MTIEEHLIDNRISTSFQMMVHSRSSSTSFAVSRSFFLSLFLRSSSLKAALPHRAAEVSVEEGGGCFPS